MTSTTTEDLKQHEQPCFCDICAACTVDDLITERAELYEAARANGHVDTWKFARELAEELIAAIPAATRGQVLDHVLTWDHLSPRVMAVDCLLDECDTRSYQALTEMSRILLDAIHAQGAEGSALRVVIENEICDPIRLEVSRDLGRIRS